MYTSGYKSGYPIKTVKKEKEETSKPLPPAIKR
jgi:hypothetical protein